MIRVAAVFKKKTKDFFLFFVNSANKKNVQQSCIEDLIKDVSFHMTFMKQALQTYPYFIMKLL